MDLHLNGKRVLITGASRGIGAVTARVFAKEGCDLLLAARSERALEELAGELHAAYGVTVTAHPADLRNQTELNSLGVAGANCDILINNAGDIPGGDLMAIDAATWRFAWDLKVMGYIDLTRLLYASMMQRGGGVIINIIGAGGERLDPNYIAGSTGNAALMAFTRCLGGNSPADGIRVVGINPGGVETERMITLSKTRARDLLGDENRYREMFANLAMGRAAKPVEIGDLAAYLASDQAAYITGTIVTIDGGHSTRR